MSTTEWSWLEYSFYVYLETRDKKPDDHAVQYVLKDESICKRRRAWCLSSLWIFMSCRVAVFPGRTTASKPRRQRVYRRDRHDAGLRFCPRTLTRVCIIYSVWNQVSQIQSEEKPMLHMIYWWAPGKRVNAVQWLRCRIAVYIPQFLIS